MSYFKEICQNKLLPYPRNLNYNSNDMKKTNKNKTIPHGITLRRFVKINFYFIQEILIPIQTIIDMEGKCQKMSIQCSCHEFPGPFSLYFYFFLIWPTWNIPLSWLGQRLKVTFFSNCHSSRELHLKSLNSISVASFEEDLFESDLAFQGNESEAYQLHYVLDMYEHA